ncbi:hypothetical protein KFU94_69855 [Chloroflexi bacterium TSY]|nr:hypothetical protein [Chloroflexi bacterium TSY]
MTTIQDEIKTLTPAQREQLARRVKRKLTYPTGSRKEVDVLIMGGGLAGLTLARQLRQARSDLPLLVPGGGPFPPPGTRSGIQGR